MQKKKIYTPEFKAQLVKEFHDAGNLSAVAKAHQVSFASLHRWITGKSQAKMTSVLPTTSAISDLKKKLADADLEIRVLKELLKKTNQAWLKD